MKQYDLVIVGGGAAGFFCALQCAERNPGFKIVILEKSKETLSKVRISGGGRCNVTHACFDPGEMVGYYPRGHKELLGPFHSFLCGDMMAWLSGHGVETKIEEDGRVFPASDRSQSIVGCFMELTNRYGIALKTQCGVEGLSAQNNGWSLKTTQGNFQAKNVLIATGSSPATWKMIATLGHGIIDPVPSLFTFNIRHPLLDGLLGISVPLSKVNIPEMGHAQAGPLLITHWGLSGPAILKLSAWAARELAAKNYHFSININWIDKAYEDVLQHFIEGKKETGKRKLISTPQFGLPKRLWQRMISLLKLEEANFADLSQQQMHELTGYLCACALQVKGKSTFKDEFVTCGGVDTKEINFKTMESKKFPGLYFAGEVINIDALTGGFNFQAAWTEAFVAAKALTEKA